MVEKENTIIKDNKMIPDEISAESADVQERVRSRIVKVELPDEHETMQSDAARIESSDEQEPVQPHAPKHAQHGRHPSHHISKPVKALLVFLSVLWVLVLMALGVYYIVFTDGKAVKDENENRMLAEAPAFTLKNFSSGDFSRQAEDYLSDHSPARTRAIRFSQELKSTLGFASYQDSLAVQNKKDEALSSDDLSDADISAMAKQTEEEKKTKGARRIKPSVNLEEIPDVMTLTLHIDNYELPYYYYDKDHVLALTSVLNRFAACLPEDGELVYTMVPQASVGNIYNGAGLKQGFVSDMEPVVNAVAAANVQAVSSAAILGAAMERGEYVYFRTDMHYSVPGTYLIYREMVTLAGQKPAAWDSYQIQVEEPFLGTLYRDNPMPYMEENPDRLDLLTPKEKLEWRRINGPDSYYPIPFLDYNAAANDRYTVYLGGPAGPWTYAKIDNGKTRKALVVCDSFGLAFVPMLTQNYGEVHYYDPRYFDQAVTGYSVKDMIARYGISDIYVVIGDLHSYDNDFLLVQASSQLGDQ